MRQLNQQETSFCSGGSLLSANPEIFLVTVGLLGACAYLLYEFGKRYEVTGYALNPGGSISPVISVKQ